MTAASMNRPALTNTHVTNVRLQSDYFERLGCSQRKPGFVSFPFVSALSNQPELAARPLPAQIFICMEHPGKGVKFLFLRKIKVTNLYALEKLPFFENTSQRTTS